MKPNLSFIFMLKLTDFLHSKYSKGQTIISLRMKNEEPTKLVRTSPLRSFAGKIELRKKWSSIAAHECSKNQHSPENSMEICEDVKSEVWFCQVLGTHQVLLKNPIIL